ncbi:MAG: enoyl-CoA hydratase/isomerase family protein [Polyangiaceae bacterium]|nr:enoyl-CoA hydratase/isomerase family protein [Polyangiaceae bacterium]
MPNVHVVREGAVATLVLDDPARKNAMSVDLGDALRQRVRELAGDPTLRAAVITGAGGAFSAGGDLSMLERLRTSKEDEARVFMLEFYGRYLSVLDLGVPLVAAVDGPAIGAGLAVALACHITIVAEDAKLALNFASLGLYPGMGSTYFAARRMGDQRAAEILLTGRRFDGREAVRIGAALEAVPANEVLPRAKALAQTIAEQGPLATRSLADALGPDRAALAAALEREAREQAKSYVSQDLGEGLRAAAERRKPAFVGR